MGTNEKRRRASQDEALTYEDTTEVGGTPPSKKARTEARTSLFVRSLPKSATAESLTQFFSEHFPVKHATVILDKNTKESRGYGFVTFTDADDAREAMAKFNKHLIDGRHIQLDIAEPRHRDAKARAEGPEAAARYDNEKRRRKQEEEEARRPPKLIIRNLPWSIKESDQLAVLFRSFGRVNYADLPQKKGRQSGFGFVTIRGRKNAERAMEALNGKEIDGRTIAVDWAADKKTWEEEKVKELAAEREVKKAAKEANRRKTSRKQDDDEEKRPEVNVVVKGGDDFDPDADLMAFMEKMESFDTEDEDDEEENVVDENTNSTEENESEDGADDDVEDEDENEDLESEAQQTKRTTDNTSTVFIRNVPYTTTDEVLKSHFSKFGPVRYARVVIDKATERPAGTGFVCFFNPDVSKACIRGSPRPQPVVKGHKQSILQDHAADTDGRYTLDGRVLYVAQAVTKDEATRLADEGPAGKTKRESDKRRFYLLSEGTIPRNSPLYTALAPSEIKMRDASLAQRKKLVQSNPSLHLSLTRLALRNIPHNMDSKALKALAREAVVGFAKDVKEGHRLPLSKEEIARGGQEDRESERHRKEKGKGVVKQAKIVFEDTKGTKVTEEIGGGKSRGYGFIEFSSHRWALMGLRWLNGHALKNAAGKTQRLVVEFAIENVQVVARRRDAQAKALARQQPSAPKQESAIPASRSQQTSKELFSGKTGKRGKGKKEQELESSGEENRGKLDKATLIKQKQISRKRVMRKKKATMRHGAK